MTEDRDQNFKKEIEPRVEWLRKERKYIEAFFFLCVALEQELIKLIELYEKYTSRVVGNYGRKLNLSEYRTNKFKKMTLGQLKDYLVIFVGKGNLIKELDYFIELRNDCVHRILDKSISTLDTEVSRNLNRYYRLLFWLLRRQNKLLHSEMRSHNRKSQKIRKTLAKAR